MVRRLLIGTIVNILQLFGIAKITIIGLTANYPVMCVVSKVEGTNKNLTFILRVNTIGILGIAVTNALAIVATKTKAQTRNRIIINTKGYTILICNLELKRICSTLLNPIGVGKIISIKTSQELSLVTEFLVTTKERNTSLVPCAWHDGVFALRTVNSKEVKGLVVGVVKTNGNYDMTKAEIGCARECFLNPELLKLYFTTFLGLLFPLAAFLVFLLVSKTSASVLKLNLSTKRPALAKVVTQIDYCMGNIETTVTGIVLMLLRLTVATYVITIKIA